MSVLQQYFHAIGIFNALFLSILLFSSKRLNSASKVLAFWLILWAFYVMGHLMFTSDSVGPLSFVYMFSLWLPASFGGLLYLYIKFLVLQKEFTIRDLLKFVPLAICLLLNLDYLMMSDADIEYVRENGATRDNKHLFALFVLHSQVVFFFYKSIQLIKNYKEQATNQFLIYVPDFYFGLFTIVAINIALWLLEFTSAILGGSYFFSLTSDVLFTVYLCSLVVLHWRSPEFFNIRAVKLSANTPENKQSPKPVLDENMRRIVFDEITRYMQEKKPYLDSELNITSLGEEMNLSKHYISEAINRISNKNFQQFVNEYRVEYCCKQIKAQPNSKVLDIGLGSGFASKSAFNMVFKKLKGVTPTQYRASILSN